MSETVPSSIESISDSDWAQTPNSVKRYLLGRIEQLERTNNAAERTLRPAVLWRKNSCGSQSEVGSLFVSRMLTVTTSLQAHNRSVLEYLVQACRASRQGLPAPSLLPVQNHTL